MPATDYLPARECDLAAFVTTMLRTLEADPVGYGLDSDTLDALTAHAAYYMEAHAAAEAAKAEARARVTTKNAAKEALIEFVREVARQIQANPSVNSGMKLNAGLPAREKSHSRVSPAVPEELAVWGTAVGANELRWKPGGNKQGTLYMIQTRTSESEPWTLVDTTTKTKYRHEGQVVGQTRFYRVLAKRPMGVSPPSNVGVAFGQQTAATLPLAA
jgi:hypothetical protein